MFCRILFGGLSYILLSSPVLAAEGSSSSELLNFTISNLWILIAAAMVFIMHLGFAGLEAGMTQSKNAVNVIFKNTAILSIGILSFAFVGFNLMYPGEEFAGAFFGFGGFGIGTDAAGVTPAYNSGYTYWSDFLFQAMFAATAATTISGAVAERIRLHSFLVFVTLFLTFCYPIAGMWKWGGGVLDAMSTPFYDFAGSTLVHSVGGWGALICAALLGPRLGRYTKKNAIKPHSYPLATVGVFLLWFGWYGFNGGSVLSANPAAVSLVFVTTTLAAAAGIMGAMLITWFGFKKPNLGMILNGALAGLVGITAGADVMGPLDAVFIGLIAGALVVLSIRFFDRLKIDDPVGAISVHLVCGIWGTLAVGLFGGLASGAQVFAQLKGIALIGAFSASFSFVVYKWIDLLLGMRVSAAEEEEGLDFHEHKEVSYDFRIPTPSGVPETIHVEATVDTRIEAIQ